MKKSLRLIVFCLSLILLGQTSRISAAPYISKVDTEQVLTLPNTATSTTSTTASLNMRSGASAKYRRVLTIPKGRSVTVLSTASNGWKKVSYGGKTGYVSGKYLTTKSVASAPPASKKSYSPNKLYIMGKTLNYKNGGQSQGQSIIDKNISTISTWGGAPVWSGTDNKNTHFIGHSHGGFKGIWNIKIGETITITDSKGNPTHYRTTEKLVLDDNGYNTTTKVSMYNYVVSSGGGEVITLQTCKTKTTNWIIRAVKIN